MPRELLGDRAYHPALRRLGVKNPGDVPVGVPVQLTASVDNLEHLAEPLGLELYAFGHTEGAIALERSCIAVLAGRGGLWVQWMTSNAGDFNIYRDDALALTGVAAIAILPWSGAANAVDLRATAYGFHMTAVAMGAPATAFHWDVGVGSAFIESGFYIGPGQRIIWQGNADANAKQLSLIFREVPGPSG